MLNPLDPLEVDHLIHMKLPQIQPDEKVAHDAYNRSGLFQVQKFPFQLLPVGTLQVNNFQSVGIKA
ncbi:Uncharacterised protein [Mycobacterium tuberculosis]|nr:Uncharacterised protein [Mycobacterium tuberculosis]